MISSTARDLASRSLVKEGQLLTAQRLALGDCCAKPHTTKFDSLFAYLRFYFPLRQSNR